MTCIVLLPGMDGTGKLFSNFLLALDKNFEPIVISYPVDGPQDYETLKKFTLGLLPLNRPFFILAESFSGPLAIALAASRPSGLMGLVLCASFDRNPIPFLRLLRWAVGCLPISSKFTSFIAPLLFGRFSTNELVASTRTALNFVSTSALRARMKAVIDVNVSHQVRQIEVPILYLQALEDRIISDAVLRRLLMENSEIEVAQFMGPHLLLQATPKETAKVVTAFFDRIQTKVSNQI